MSTIIAIILFAIGGIFLFFGLFSSYVISDESGFSEKFPNHHPIMILFGTLFMIAAGAITIF